MTLVNCESNLIITSSRNFFLVADTVANQEPTFTVTDTKLYFPVVTLSTHNNAKLLELKSGFKWKITMNKYQSEVSIRTQNQY